MKKESQNQGCTKCGYPIRIHSASVRLQLCGNCSRPRKIAMMERTIDLGLGVTQTLMTGVGTGITLLAVFGFRLMIAVLVCIAGYFGGTLLASQIGFPIALPLAILGFVCGWFLQEIVEVAGLVISIIFD